VTVTVDSLNRIVKIKNDEKLISINKASMELNEDENTFFWTWVKTGFVKHTNTGLKIYISKKCLQKVVEFKSEYISSVEAAEKVGHHRSYLPNLEKQGLIEHKKLFRNSKYNIKFYSRKEVEMLLKSI
jgi:hypothetical protein